MVKEFAELMLPYLNPEDMLQNPPVPNSTFMDKFENDSEFRQEIIDKILNHKAEENAAQSAKNKSGTGFCRSKGSKKKSKGKKNKQCLI